MSALRRPGTNVTGTYTRDHPQIVSNGTAGLCVICQQPVYVGEGRSARVPGLGIVHAGKCAERAHKMMGGK